MTKPFLEQLENWIDLEDFVELEKCEFKVAEMLKNFGRVAAEMDANESSFLWKDPMALAVHKELKKLKALVKMVNTLYKKKVKHDSAKLRDQA